MPKWLQAASNVHPAKSEYIIFKSHRLHVTGSDGHPCSALSNRDDCFDWLGVRHILPPQGLRQRERHQKSQTASGGGETPGRKLGTHRAVGVSSGLQN